MNKRWRMVLAGATLVGMALTSPALASAGGAARPGDPHHPTHPDQPVRGGNLDCPSGTTSIKLDKTPAVGDRVTDGTVTVTVTAVKVKLDDSGDIVAFRFSVEPDGAVKHVIVKGGPKAVTYWAGQADPWFYAPIIGQKGSGSPHHEVSNVQFCVSAPVVIEEPGGLE